MQPQNPQPPKSSPSLPENLKSTGTGIDNEKAAPEASSIHSPRPMKATGLPWDDPNSDPMGDIRLAAAKARGLDHDLVAGDKLTIPEDDGTAPRNGHYVIKPVHPEPSFELGAPIEKPGGVLNAEGFDSSAGLNRAQRRAQAKRSKAPSLAKLGDTPNIALDGPMKGDDFTQHLSAPTQDLLILHAYDPRDTHLVHQFIDRGGDDDPERPRVRLRVIDYAYVRGPFGWTFAGARDGGHMTH